MKYLLHMLLLSLSCTVNAMDTERLVAAPLGLHDLELQLQSELQETLPTRYGCCCLVLVRQEAPRFPQAPETLEPLGESYKHALVALEKEAGNHDAALNEILASMERVRQIINDETAHIKGGYIHTARRNWMNSVLAAALVRGRRPLPDGPHFYSPHIERVRTEFPDNIRKSADDRYYIPDAGLKLAGSPEDDVPCRIMCR